MTDFERGAEAMREAAAKALEDRYGYGWGSFIATVRALPLPVQPPGSESREARLERENTRQGERLALVEPIFANIAAMHAQDVADDAAADAGIASLLGEKYTPPPDCDCAVCKAVAATSDKSLRPPDARPEEKK